MVKDYEIGNSDEELQANARWRPEVSMYLIPVKSGRSFCRQNVIKKQPIQMRVNEKQSVREGFVEAL